MSTRRSIGYIVLDTVTPKAITSSTNAAPIEITKASHWYVTWDKILITGHVTNTAANWMWTVTKTWTNTLTLDWSTGNGVWWATWIMMTQPKMLYVDDFRTCTLSVDTASSANFTMKTAWSTGKSTTSWDYPNFWASQSATNQYDFVEMVDLQDWAYIDWDTWFVPTWTDDHKQYEVNTNWLKWLTVYCTAWTAWSITVKATLYDNL